jgi:hypothetical protein
MTSGDATKSTREHHGQEIDRTKAERTTYAVGRDAEVYVTERRDKAREKIRSGLKTEVCKLPKGTRSIVGRETRFSRVHAAGRVVAGEEKATPRGMEHKRRMLAGELDHVLAQG